MHKEFKFDDDARKEMLEGINTIVKAITSTLGPGGRLVCYKGYNNEPALTKDGITVAKRSLPLASRFADMGARLVKSASDKSVQATGDGTTATALLLGSIVNEGLRLVAAGHNPVNLKKGVDLCVEKVVEELRRQSIPVSSLDEIEQVATISSNGDKEIGRLLRQAFEKVGNSGIVTVEKGKETETKLDVVNGYRFDKGYLTQYFATNEKMECILQDARILVTDVEINNVNVILPILEATDKAYHGKPLLVIASNVVGDALGTLVVNHKKGALASCAVKAPGFGNRRTEMLMDICALTGATFISDVLGLRIEQFDPSWLGGADRIVINAGSTTIVNGMGAEEEVEARVAQIRNQIASCDGHEKKQQEERLAKLVGGVAVIYCGGFSDAEIDERLDRLDDSLGATRAAVEQGIIPGGGTSLLRIAREFNINSVPDELQYGARIVLKAIQGPTRKIAENAGKDASEIVMGVVSNSNPHFGYNAQTDKFEDLVASGVVDPTKVVVCALQNAASVAGLILTTDCMIADQTDEQDLVSKK